MNKKEKYSSDIKYILIETLKGFGKYLRGLLIIFLINLVILSVGFKFTGQNLWFLLALIVAVVDIFPVFGSGMILVPWALLEVYNGNLTLAAWIGIIYVVIVVVRLVGEPLIIGKSVGVSPLLSIGITVIGTLLFGPIGAIVATVLVVPLKIIWNLLGDKSIFKTGYNKVKSKVSRNKNTPL